MAGNTQSYSNSGAGFNQLTAEQAEFYQRTMLDRLLPNLFFMKYGQKKNIPKNSGDTTSFRRLNSLNVNTTALTEGVTPDAVDLNISKVTAKVSQYGAWTKLTDFIQLVGLDPLLTEVSQLMGENAAESMDCIVRDIIAAGTNVLYGGGRASRATVAATDTITAKDIIKMRKIMKTNKVKEISLPGGGKGYLAFAHPSVMSDIMLLQEWKDQNTYVDTKNREQGIVGQMYGIYFLEAVNAPKFAGAGAAGIDVYGTLVIGDGAYGIPDVSGSSKPEIIVKPAGSAGTADPLNQFSTVAWKCAFTTTRLNELCILRYESASAF